MRGFLAFCLYSHTCLALSLKSRVLRPFARPARPPSPSLPIQGYVPDGLTPAQYAKIKQDEAVRQANMNYGVYGPRHRQSQQASDDWNWMMQPRLWTQGYYRDTPADVAPVPPNRFHRTRHWLLRTALPAFSLAFLGLDILLMAVALWYGMHLSFWDKLKMAALVRFTNDIVLMQAYWRFLTVRLVLCGTIFAPLLHKTYFEHAHRRWMWSKRQTVVRTLIVMLGCLAAWTAILHSWEYLSV